MFLTYLSLLLIRCTLLCTHSQPNKLTSKFSVVSRLPVVRSLLISTAAALSMAQISPAIADSAEGMTQS